MQRLTLPYRFQEVLAGYKVSAYPKVINTKTGRPRGYHHFGWDLFSYDNPVATERGKIYSSGTGKVIAVGWDNAVGNVVVIQYDKVQMSNGTAIPLVARYMHLARYTCFAGQAVVAGTLLGIEGNTGTTGTHLHIEFDKDTKWPMWSVQVVGSNLIRNGGKAIDSTVDPATVFWARQGDVILPSRYGAGWNTAKDTQLALLQPIAQPSPDADLLERLQRAEKTISSLEGEIADCRAELTGVKTRLSQIRTLATI